MAAEDRLTAEQLAALEPGDPVVVESARNGFGRPHHAAGTVLRVTPSRVAVRVQDRRGAVYVEEFRVRDGLRDCGRSAPAYLIAADAAEPVQRDVRRRSQRVDAAYREWARHREDPERLRALQAVIEDFLQVSGPVWR